MALSFFRTPPHNSFHYQPRYWDPEKEDVKQREELIKREMGVSEATDTEGNYKPQIKGQMRRRFERPNSAVAKERKSSNIRLVLIFLVLAAGAYFLLFW